MPIMLKRAYAVPQDEDGFRILVDRLWPRGLGKEHLRLDAWLKEIAPSDNLRQWFGHDPEKWDEFKRRYFEELGNNRELVEDLRAKGGTARITLVYGARDEKRNNAVALREYLLKGGSADPRKSG
ncbi:MAG: hypothetical protein A2X84_05800 [Desulfuromonadaceae bacterium GWC2_58_13]|nr:MAG: hypothetical protein A2X84_05800 [Desulfuromonadaceae bacterium GWC2_58_13]